MYEYCIKKIGQDVKKAKMMLVDEANSQPAVVEEYIVVAI